MGWHPRLIRPLFHLIFDLAIGRRHHRDARRGNCIFQVHFSTVEIPAGKVNGNGSAKRARLVV